MPIASIGPMKIRKLKRKKNGSEMNVPNEFGFQTRLRPCHSDPAVSPQLSPCPKKSSTMKPSMRSRLVTTRPGTAIGPGAGFSTSYCETLPQQAMRPLRFISDSAASSTGPPILSK